MRTIILTSIFLLICSFTWEESPPSDDKCIQYVSRQTQIESSINNISSISIMPPQDAQVVCQTTLSLLEDQAKSTYKLIKKNCGKNVSKTSMKDKDKVISDKLKDLKDDCKDLGY